MVRTPHAALAALSSLLLAGASALSSGVWVGQLPRTKAQPVCRYLGEPLGQPVYEAKPHLKGLCRRRLYNRRTIVNRRTIGHRCV